MAEKIVVLTDDNGNSIFPVTMMGCIREEVPTFQPVRGVVFYLPDANKNGAFVVYQMNVSNSDSDNNIYKPSDPPVVGFMGWYDEEGDLVNFPTSYYGNTTRSIYGRVVIE